MCRANSRLSAPNAMQSNVWSKGELTRCRRVDFQQPKGAAGCVSPNRRVSDSRLNQGQRQAVTKALAAPDVFFCKGRPALANNSHRGACRQMVKQGKRTLITSQANLAVDSPGSLYPGPPSPELRPLRELDSRRNWTWKMPTRSSCRPK